jgi:predicted dehydrogenase
MTTLRGALIGCGFFADHQLNAWAAVKGAELVALCDRDSARVQAAGDKFGIAARYVDAEEMFAREQLDFVDIATTLPSHRVLVEMAARHGVPVICQKPFAATLEDGWAMVAACAAAQVPLMVHENFRWQSPALAVKAALDSGRIGTPFWSRISFRSGYDVIAGQPYLAEGKRFIIEDLGIHILDLARYFFGEARSISATTQRVNPAIRGEDVATMLLTHRNGVTAVVDCSYVSKRDPEGFPQTTVEIEGTNGSILLSVGYELRIVDNNGTETIDMEPPLLPWAARPWHSVQESVLLIQQHWIDRLLAHKPPDTSGEDNLKTLALVDAAYRSAETGNTVKLEDA